MSTLAMLGHQYQFGRYVLSLRANDADRSALVLNKGREIKLTRHWSRLLAHVATQGKSHVKDVRKSVWDSPPKDGKRSFALALTGLQKALDAKHLEAYIARDGKGFLELRKPLIQLPADRRALDVLASAPPLQVRSVLITAHDKTNLVKLLRYFKDRGIIILATPNTATYVRQEGYECITTFQYTSCTQLLSHRGSLHPHILASIAAVSTDRAHMQALKQNGLRSIDLVVANTYDPVVDSLATARELMDQLSNVQIGGAGLIRWTLKNWRSAAAVVDPEDYMRLIDDLRANNDTVSTPMRLALMRRAMGYVKDRDHQTGRLFNALWPWLS
jgi:hypothetical protein